MEFPADGIVFEESGEAHGSSSLMQSGRDFKHYATQKQGLRGGKKGVYAAFWRGIMSHNVSCATQNTSLAAIPGHSRLETTGRYLHPTAERMLEAVEGV